jgi:hypothetical protein
MEEAIVTSYISNSDPGHVAELMNGRTLAELAVEAQCFGRQQK